MAEIQKVHAYWRDPDSDPQVRQDYRDICKPDYYIGLKPVSDMWVGIFEQYIPKESTILELGCSVGRNLYYLEQAGWSNLTGVEINPRAQKLSAANFGAQTAGHILNSTIEDYLSKPRAFDVVFTSGVLMHICRESDWIFPKMAETAQKWLMVSEVEDTAGPYKFARQYKPLFERLGFTQVHEQVAMPQSPLTILRVFRRNPN